MTQTIDLQHENIYSATSETPKRIEIVDALFVLEPKLLALHYGGWMAMTGAESPIRIAVVGDNETEARARFAESVACWREIGRSDTTGVPSHI
jgi:hypothetical protein